MRSSSKHELIQNNNYSVVIVIVICVLSLVQFVRLFFVFPSTDESYYFTQALRFAQGDVIFRDSWDVIQTQGIFLTPIYYVYLKIFGGKGIVLFGRILYFALVHFIALIMYNELKCDIGTRFALPISFAIAVYAPFSLYTVGYNQLLLSLTILTSLCFNIGIKKWKTNCFSGGSILFFTGVLQSAAVASYPTSVILLPIHVVIMLMIVRINNKDGAVANWKKPFAVYVLGMVAIGIWLVLYIVFVTGINDFIFSISKIIEYYNNIHGVTISDIGYSFTNMLFGRLFTGAKSRSILFLLGLLTIFSAGCRVWERHHGKNRVVLIIYSISIAFSIIWVLFASWHCLRIFYEDKNLNNLLIIGFINIIALATPLLMIVPLKDHSSNKLKWFTLLGAMSIFDTLLVGLTSGGMFYQAAYALFGCVAYFFILLCMHIKSASNYSFASFNNTSRSFGNTVALVSCVLFSTSLLFFQFADVYGGIQDSNVKDIFNTNTVRIYDGPSAGLRTNMELASFDYDLNNAVKKYSKQGRGVTVLENYPYAYGIAPEMRTLTQNTWRPTLYTAEKYTDNIYYCPLLDYYEYKDEMPYMIVYCGNNDFINNPDQKYRMHEYILTNYSAVEIRDLPDSDEYDFIIFILKENNND